MKARIGLCILMAVAITATSFTKSYGQTSEFPPVQKLLDKVAGKEFEENMMQKETVSQLFTNNSFTWSSKNIDYGGNNKQIYSGINWNEFAYLRIFTLKNEDKYIQCSFYFDNNVKVTLYKNEEQFYTGQTEKYINCFILAKDKKAFIKVVDEWKAARKK